MQRQIHRTAVAVLAIALLTLPAAAIPADVDHAPGEAAWSHGVSAWLAGVVDQLTDVLPWSGDVGEVQRVTGADKPENSHPTMDPNGVLLSDSDDQPVTEPQSDLEP